MHSVTDCHSNATGSAGSPVRIARANAQMFRWIVACSVALTLSVVLSLPVALTTLPDTVATVHVSAAHSKAYGNALMWSNTGMLMPLSQCPGGGGPC